MMLSAASLWTLLALSTSITGSAVEIRNSRIALPMTSRLHFSNGTNPVQRDDAHWQATGITLENLHMISCVSVGVGSPPTSYRLIVDTGSANTWIGADTPYNPTNTAVNISMGMKKTYNGGSFIGILFTDTLSLADGLTIDEMAIGVATSETRGMAYDGILGIGPTILTLGSIPSAPLKGLYTVTERLFRQGSISQPLVSLYFRPSTANTDDSGRLIFGEENPGFDIGNIAYTSTTNTKPASQFWGINQRITYGSTEISKLTAGIVDCGCTFIWIASDAYEKYKTATGAYLDPATEILSITLEQYNALRPLDFHIGEKTYSLSPNAQIWPRSLNSQLRGTANGIYLVVKNLNKPTGSGDDFRLGYVFLQRFYSVFNTRDSRIGFATTAYTDATTN
ncbi:aspartic peptidase A1 [Suillus spraguei]|nr:aspartic peptidase A1 [Suillus spraguei]